MNGALARRSFSCLLTLVTVAACSAPRARSEAEAPAAAPAQDAAAVSAPQEAERGAPGESAADVESLPDDEELADDEKKAEAPGLADPPAASPSGPASEQWERLVEEEEDFAAAMDPSALSCSGALPLRDAICQLAERICALTGPNASTEAAERDCKRARASCDKAKQSYAGRCGG